MAYTFKELKKKRVAELKEIASGIEHEAVKGYTQLTKDNLLKAICEALSLEMREIHEVKGLDKSKIKAEIKKLKKKRDKAIEAKNKTELKNIRLQIKNFKKQLRKAAA